MTASGVRSSTGLVGEAVGVTVGVTVALGWVRVAVAVDLAACVAVALGPPTVAVATAVAGGIVEVAGAMPVAVAVGVRSGPLPSSAQPPMTSSASATTNARRECRVPLMLFPPYRPDREKPRHLREMAAASSRSAQGAGTHGHFD